MNHANHRNSFSDRRLFKTLNKLSFTNCFDTRLNEVLQHSLKLKNNIKKCVSSLNNDPTIWNIYLTRLED